MKAFLLTLLCSIPSLQAEITTQYKTIASELSEKEFVALLNEMYTTLEKEVEEGRWTNSEVEQIALGLGMFEELYYYGVSQLSGEEFSSFLNEAHIALERELEEGKWTKEEAEHITLGFKTLENLYYYHKEQNSQFIRVAWGPSPIWFIIARWIKYIYDRVTEKYKEWNAEEIIKEKEERIKKLEEKNERLNNELGKERENGRAKDRTLEERDRTLEERDRTIEEQGKIIEEERESGRGKDRKLEKQDRTLEEQDRTLEEQRERIRVLEGLISSIVWPSEKINDGDGNRGEDGDGDKLEGDFEYYNSEDEHEDDLSLNLSSPSLSPPRRGSSYGRLLFADLIPRRQYVLFRHRKSPPKPNKKPPKPNEKPPKPNQVPPDLQSPPSEDEKKKEEEAPRSIPNPSLYLAEEFLYNNFPITESLDGNYANFPDIIPKFFPEKVPITELLDNDLHHIFNRSDRETPFDDLRPYTM